MDNPMEEKLERLAELNLQNFQEPGIEPSDEFVALSKEVASHYQPIVELLVEAGIIMINVIPQCAVFEAETVMPAHKSYFNGGKILLFGDLDERINSEKNGKLKPEFKDQYGKFVAQQIPWGGAHD